MAVGRPRPANGARRPWSAPSPVEVAVAAVAALALGAAAVIEPDVLEAPFASPTATAATVGGAVLAVAAYVGMLRLRVPPAARILVVGVPLVAASWWTISPYFVDDVVDERFAASIADSQVATDPPAGEAPAGAPAERGAAEGAPTTTAPPAPQLLGAGAFVGLAGHEGTGDAGIFRDVDGSLVLRFERFDIENGPDLEVYLVPGADQTSLAPGSLHLGALKGNVGDQGYVLPPGTELGAGPYTALVWCDVFDVEFVGATITIG